MRMVVGQSAAFSISLNGAMKKHTDSHCCYTSTRDVCLGQSRFIDAIAFWIMSQLTQDT
jgi:hypothetical protein